MHFAIQNNRVYHLGSLFGGSTPPPSPPPPVPTSNQSVAAAAQQQAHMADPNAMTYASTLLTGAAQPTTQQAPKVTLLGG